MDLGQIIRCWNSSSIRICGKRSAMNEMFEIPKSKGLFMSEGSLILAPFSKTNSTFTSQIYPCVVSPASRSLVFVRFSLPCLSFSLISPVKVDFQSSPSWQIHLPILSISSEIFGLRIQGNMSENLTHPIWTQIWRLSDHLTRAARVPAPLLVSAYIIYSSFLTEAQLTRNSPTRTGTMDPGVSLCNIQRKRNSSVE